MNPKLTPERLSRKAIVYIRQSKPSQLIHNQESTRLQFSLADRARTLGFQRVIVVDDDLGRTGSGWVDRPGFERLAAEVCGGEVGAIFWPRRGNLWVIDELQAAVSVRNRRNFRQVESKDLCWSSPP